MDEILKARIHSFESFGTVDGPGIRFVVFMQGCALKCKYCHNRDTWDLCGGTEYTLEEILTRIKKYKNYFIPSGGGVTFSGGEPLLQLKFLLKIIPILKKEGIHVAIDTSGNFDLTEDIKKVKAQGIRLYAAHLKGSLSYDRSDYKGGTGFMIGNESRGLCKELGDMADSYIKIPMCGQVESLNAAIAASVLLFEAARQRRK